MPYPTYNPTVADTSNLVGKQFTGLHSQDLVTTGIQTDTIIGYADRYQIDLFGNMQTYEAEETPLLTLLSNLGTIPVNAPVIVWNDVYRGNQWFDIHLDDFRLRDAVDAVNTTNTTSAYTKRYNPLAYSAAANDGTAATNGITADYLPSPIHGNGANYTTYVGGRLPLYVLKKHNDTVLPSNGAAALTLNTHYEAHQTLPSTVKPIIINGEYDDDGNTHVGTGIAWIGFKADAAMLGNVFNVWNNLRNVALFAKYVEAATTGSALGTTLTYTPGTSIAPIYLAIDSMMIALSGQTTEEHRSIIVKIDQAVVRTDSNVVTLWFKLDFNPGSTNLECDQEYYLGENATTDGSSISIYEPVGSISRMVLLGSPSTAALPVPEGDKFVAGTNINRSGERVENFTQIFVSPSYGVTGTAQASKLRFLDTFQETRAEYLVWYKRQIEATLYNGIKAETTAVSTSNAFVNGQPVRQMGGLFDRALFPIRYMTATVPYSIGVQGATLRTFIDKLADTINAFKNKGAKDITFMCSGKFKRRLSQLVDQYMGVEYSGAPNGGSFARGGQIQRQVPSEVTFNLQIDSFVTIDNIRVKFIHDKALDYMASLNLPYYLSLNSYGAQDILIAIDTQNIKRGILRPDQIHGNIQDNGQDAFLEAMRGESTLMLRMPRNHTIVMLTYASN